MQIDMTGISKNFAGVQVLQDVSFNLCTGEIHALMGENGAGKSTLMKILTGLYPRDAGEITIDGSPVNFKHPKEAEGKGIVFIHQELNVMPDLTVEENMFMGKDIKNKWGLLDKKEMRKEVMRVVELLGLRISPTAIMRQLSVGQQQLVEIAKALMSDARVIIMDEPTAALTQVETETLFRIARDLKTRGVSIVYISHRMEEIFALCDRITVLRDGQYVDTKNVSNTDINDIIRMMIGRELGERYPTRNVEKGDIAIEVCALTKKPYFENVSFSVRSGEVLGVAGLMGAGRTEIMRAVFGALKIDSGHVKLKGKEVRIKNPAGAKKAGIGFVTEDRKIEGLMLEESIKSNISLNNLDKISMAGVVLHGTKERSLSNQAVEKLAVRTSGIEQTCRTLSGGNQQKIVFAKWMYGDPDVLILDEPTRGVDVGAKKEIYSLICRLAERGVAIIMVSSDLPEVLGMSDRIMVVHEGKISGIIEAAQANQEKIMILATGGDLK
ncbi:MAG: sugar ABC transporter ATP-binding protein [Spirochaetes bacterium]|nr:sugar ABC transporter ATP-binding protein [Spirochaetota bacterium]